MCAINETWYTFGMDFNEHSLLKALINYNQLSDDHVDQLFHPRPLKTTQNILFKQAKEIINQALIKHEKIMIFGDYDADGLCGTSILVWTLRSLGCDVGFYIPNRFTDGYGLNPDTTQRALSKGYRLFLTVDNGVSAHEGLNLIHEAKGQCIVIDHHPIHEDVNCSVLIHPDFLEEGYTTLCGSGLAHQLSRHLIGEVPYMDVLAGIATLADMMPLWDHNRSLVQHALQVLNTSDFATIKALLKSKTSDINEEDLSFQLIPKLNAVGRLADIANPNRVVDYLCLDDLHQIESFAQQMETINQQRKDIHQSMYTLALSKPLNDSIIMIEDEQFHEGIVGITAGKLAQSFKKPSVVFHNNGLRLKGSARSYGSIDLRTLFEPALDLVTRFGGHASAAGLELKTENFEAFKERVLQNHIDQTEQIQLDGLDFNPHWLDVSMFMSLRDYGPFGMGFQIPSFKFAQSILIEKRTLKTGVKYRLDYQGLKLDLLDFNGQQELPLQTLVTVWAKVHLSTYQNQTSLSLWLETWS